MTKIPMCMKPIQMSSPNENINFPWNTSILPHSHIHLGKTHFVNYLPHVTNREKLHVFQRPSSFICIIRRMKITNKQEKIIHSKLFLPTPMGGHQFQAPFGPSMSSTEQSQYNSRSYNNLLNILLKGVSSSKLLTIILIIYHIQPPFLKHYKEEYHFHA